jgi:hypothetical protein
MVDFELTQSHNSQYVNGQFLWVCLAKSLLQIAIFLENKSELYFLAENYPAIT